MADELNKPSVEAEKEAAQDAVRPGPVTPQEPVRQPDAKSTTSGEANGEHKPPAIDFTKLNLDELPQFRQYKSAMDKKLGETARQYEQRMRELQDRLDATAMSGMDDVEKVQYENRSMKDRYKEMEAKVQAMQMEKDKFDFLTQINTEYGIPMSDLAGAESPSDVQVLVANHLKKQVEETNKTWEQKYKELEAKVRSGSEENQVDVGGGAPPDEADDLRADYAEALSHNDVREMLRLSRIANAKNISLKP